MDNKMIERCELAINKLQDTGEIVGVKQVVIEVIKTMREPTENMKMAGSVDPGSGGPDEGYETEVWQSMIDAITG